METCTKKIFLADYFEEKEADNNVDGNIIALTFRDVNESLMNHLNTNLPIICTNSDCKAILSCFSHIYGVDEYKVLMAQNSINKHNEKNKTPRAGMIAFEKLAKTQKLWVCEFCRTHNLLPWKFSLPKSNDEFYVEKNEDEKLDLGCKKSSDLEQSIIFCIDCSGSMKGENMRSVKKAIYSQLEDISARFPNKKIGLVAFECDVKVFGDGSQKMYGVPNEYLGSFEKCLKCGEDLADSYMTKGISASLNDLKFQIEHLLPLGGTALGPGLLVSMGLISKARPGSMVLVCTDGLANFGVGSMVEDHFYDPSPDPERFYKRVGSLAKERGILVSVLTIKGGVCKIDFLSMATEASGGIITRIQPKALERDFGKAVDKGEMIGINAILELHLSNTLYFRGSDNDLLDRPSCIKRDLGNVTLSTEQTFEFQLRGRKELAEMGVRLDEIKQARIQARIQYLNLEGDPVLRVISLNLETTKDLCETNRGCNVRIAGMRAAFHVAQAADQGSYFLAKEMHIKWSKFMDELRVFNKDNEDFGKYYNIIKIKNNELERQIDKTIARKLKNKNKEFLEEFENLSNHGQEIAMDCAKNNSSCGSSDECQVNLKKFAKRREKSYCNLSVAEANDLEKEENKAESDCERAERIDSQISFRDLNIKNGEFLEDEKDDKIDFDALNSENERRRKDHDEEKIKFKEKDGVKKHRGKPQIEGKKDKREDLEMNFMKMISKKNFKEDILNKSEKELNVPMPLFKQMKLKPRPESSSPSEIE